MRAAARRALVIIFSFAILISVCGPYPQRGSVIALDRHGAMELGDVAFRIDGGPVDDTPSYPRFGKLADIKGSVHIGFFRQISIFERVPGENCIALKVCLASHFATFTEFIGFFQDIIFFNKLRSNIQSDRWYFPAVIETQNEMIDRSFMTMISDFRPTYPRSLLGLHYVQLPLHDQLLLVQGGKLLPRGSSSIIHSLEKNAISYASGHDGSKYQNYRETFTKASLAVAGLVLLFGSFKLVGNAVQRVDYLHIIFVLLAFPLFALGIATFLYILGFFAVFGHWMPTLQR